MPTVDDLGESKFISKADVQRPILLTIKEWRKMDVSLDSQPEKMKYVLLFNETQKPFVLNKTNGQLIAHVAGSADFDDWIGKQIVLYYDPTIMFAGELKGGIRVRAPKNQQVEQQESDVPF